MKTSIKRAKQKGYSLATLAVLVAAFSAATVGLMTYNQHAPSLGKKSEDFNEVNKIIEYIKNYADSSDIIPCPANPTLPTNHADYLKSDGIYPDCNLTLPRKSASYFKGLVPTRTIGINDSYAFDNNHAHLTYIVGADNKYLKINTDYSCISKEGALVAGCSYTNPSQFIQFSPEKAPNIAIISHGGDQVGAFIKDQTSLTPFSKAIHQIQSQILANGKYFDSIPQAINHDYYLARGVDEIIFKPLVPLGNPSNTSATLSNIKYDDVVQYARINTSLNKIGTIQCWGYNDTATPSVANPLMTGKAVYPGDFVNCAILSNDDLKCWGLTSADNGRVHPAIKVKFVTGGPWSKCAIKLDDTVACWGSGTLPLGLATTKVKAIASNMRSYCVIKENDDVECWGAAGTGNVAPAAIKAKAIISSEHKLPNAFCAIKLDDYVECWGDDSTPLATRVTTPAPAIQAKSIYLNTNAACAVKLDNSVQCWGNTSNGGTTPTPALTTEILYPSRYAFCAIKSDNNAQCWGNSSSGGTGHASARDLTTIAGGGNGMCSIKLDDSVFCWTTNYNTPVNDNTVQAKEIVMSHSTNSPGVCAIVADNTVKCWGAATSGGTTPSPAIKAYSNTLVAGQSSICAIVKPD
jgi:hypothetical protein